MKAGLLRTAGLCLVALALSTTASHATTLDIPDSLPGNVFDTLDVPVLIANQVSRNIIAVDLVIGFRPNVLTGTDQFRLGASATGWLAVVNPYPESVLIAMASASPLQAGDTLLVLRMVADTADTSTIEFMRVALNEGQLPCTTDAGMFYGSGAGIEEQQPSGFTRLDLPTVVSTTIPLPGEQTAILLDASGRRVAELAPGANDISHVDAGVYFIVLGRRVAKVAVQH